MPPSPEQQPIVYVETNWLVALLLPHDRNHRPAIDLFANAMEDLCEVRLPVGSFLEAQARVDKENRDRPADLGKITTLLRTASRNGFEELSSAEKELGSVAVRSYFGRRPGQYIAALEENPKLRKLHDPRRELETMTRLRRRLTKFGAEDRFDFYVLASVLADRESTSRERAAVFCTMDKNAFEPSGKAKAKISLAIYQEYGLWWSGDFDWRRATRNWRLRRA